MYIPFNLRMYRIMGRNRREPCGCGHFHTSKKVILPPDWVETATEVIKKTPYGDIVLRKKRVKNVPIE